MLRVLPYLIPSALGASSGSWSTNAQQGRNCAFVGLSHPCRNRELGNQSRAVRTIEVIHLVVPLRVGGFASLHPYLNGSQRERKPSAFLPTLLAGRAQ